MGILALKCPNCHGDLQLDDTREFGFCQYCGTRIVIQRDVNNISINVSMREQVATQMRLLQGFYDAGRFRDALQVFGEIRAMNALDAEAWRIGAYSMMREYGCRGSLERRDEIEQCLSRYAILAGVGQPAMEDCLAEMYPEEWKGCAADESRLTLEEFRGLYETCDSVREIRSALDRMPRGMAGNPEVMRYRVKVAMMEGDADAVADLVGRIRDDGGFEDLVYSVSSDGRPLEISPDLNAMMRIIRDMDLAQPVYYAGAYLFAVRAEENGAQCGEVFDICGPEICRMASGPIDLSILRSLATFADRTVDFSVRYGGGSYLLRGLLLSDRSVRVVVQTASGRYEAELSDSSRHMSIRLKVPDVFRVVLSFGGTEKEIPLLAYGVEDRNPTLGMRIDPKTGDVSVDRDATHRLYVSELRPNYFTRPEASSCTGRSARRSRRRCACRRCTPRAASWGAPPAGCR